MQSFCQEAKVTWPNNRTLNVVFHGHSVLAGYFKVPEVHSFEAYPQLFFHALKSELPYANINVITTAIGGEDSRNGEKRFKKDVLAFQPDVVGIDYALNDRYIPLKRAKRAWVSMIKQAKRSGAKVILFTPTPDLAANLDNPQDPLNLHAEQIRALSREYNVALVDSLAAFKELAQSQDISTLMAEPNHPNAQGHQVVLQQILPWFEPCKSTR